MTTAMPSFVIPSQDANAPATPPAMLQQRMLLARALMNQGSSTDPIRSPWQGAANLAKAIQGGWEYGQAQNQYNQITQNDADTRKQFLAAALAKTGGGSADPSAAGTPPAAPANGDNPGSMMGGILGVGQGLWNGGQSLWNGLTGGGQSGAPAQPAPPQAPPASNGTVSPQPDTNQPLSVRNNNPGNLVDNAWTQSLPGYKGANGRFAVFDSPQSGGAAMASNLTSYAHHGVDTLLGLTSRWAPSGDGSNNPALYAKTISDATGIPVDAKIDLTDPATVNKIMPVMAAVERGGSGGSMVSTGGQGAGGMPSPSAPNPNKDLMASSLRVLMDPLATPGMIESAKMVLSSQMPTPYDFKTVKDAMGNEHLLRTNPRMGTAQEIYNPRTDPTALASSPVPPMGGMPSPAGNTSPTLGGAIPPTNNGVSAPPPTATPPMGGMPASPKIFNAPQPLGAQPGMPPRPATLNPASGQPASLTPIPGQGGSPYQPAPVQMEKQLASYNGLTQQGDAYLAQLEQSADPLQRQIGGKARSVIQHGWTLPQTGKMADDPLNQYVMQAINIAAPNFDPQLAQQRYDLANSYNDKTINANGGKVDAIKNATAALYDMQTAYSALHNSNSPFYNAAANFVKSFGASPLSAFNSARNRYALEISKLQTGGVPSEQEIKQMEGLFSENMPAQNAEALFKQHAEGLYGMAGNLDHTWKNLMGPNSAHPDVNDAQHNIVKNFDIPPAPGAQKGADGNWYVPSTKVPGTYRPWQ